MRVKGEKVGRGDLESKHGAGQTGAGARTAREEGVRRRKLIQRAKQAKNAARSYSGRRRQQTAKVEWENQGEAQRAKEG